MYRFLLICILLLVSCDKSYEAPEPEHLIEQEVMEDILYDINLLKAARSKSYRILKDNNVKVDTYIYEKYQLDSITLRENIAYYATASFKKYKEIENNVKLRFVAEKENLELEVKERDSLKKLPDSLVPNSKRKIIDKVIDPEK